MAQRGGRGWNPEARAERLFATLACVERVNSSKADADDARLVANPGSERNGRGCVGVLTNTFLRSER